MIGILMELFFSMGGVFFNYHNDGIFTWIICAWYMLIGNKVIYLVLTSL